MRIDWIIAVFMFLIFSTWAFSYYTFMNTTEVAGKSEHAFRSSERIADYLSAAHISNVANITASSDASGIVMWARMNWSGDETNSTKVITARYSASSEPCMISGDRIYWTGDVSAGENFFYIESIDHEMAMQCGDTVSETDENQTTLWPTEFLVWFSDARNLQLCDQINGSYSQMKDSMGVSMDFNVLIDNGTEMTCGIPVPISGRDVFAFPKSGRTWEGGNVNITVRLWQ